MSHTVWLILFEQKIVIVDNYRAKTLLQGLNLKWPIFSLQKTGHLPKLANFWPLKVQWIIGSRELRIRKLNVIWPFQPCLIYCKKYFFKKKWPITESGQFLASLGSAILGTSPVMLAFKTLWNWKNNFQEMRRQVKAWPQSLMSKVCCKITPYSLYISVSAHVFSLFCFLCRIQIFRKWFLNWIC